MDDDAQALTEPSSYTADYHSEPAAVRTHAGEQGRDRAILNGSKAAAQASGPGIPDYLEDSYWWAYLRPGSVWLFEREWLVNLILWGNMHRLTDAVLDEIGDEGDGDVLQVACVYGAFSNRLAQRVGNLHVADIAPIQLENSRRKLVGRDNVQLHHMDSASLEFGDGRFSDTVVFFLLHEQPEAVRRRTIAEAVRVTRPGGRVVIVDYHRPSVWNPLRYVMHPVLKWLEPFALDLWRNPIERYFPDGFEALESVTTRYFGGMYQKVVVRLP